MRVTYLVTVLVVAVDLFPVGALPLSRLFGLWVEGRNAMLNPEVTSSIPKPENIIKETIVRLVKEADQIGYSMKLSSEVAGELQQQIQAAKQVNPNLSDLDAALSVFAQTLNCLMMVHRFDTAIHSKLLTVLLNQLSEDGYAKAYQELRKVGIQDVANEREWMLKRFGAN